MTDAPLIGVRIFDEKVDAAKLPVAGKRFAVYVVGLGNSRQEEIVGAGYVTFQNRCTYVLPAGPNDVNYHAMKKQTWVVILSTPATTPISREKLREYEKKAKAKSASELKKVRSEQDKTRADAQDEKAKDHPGEKHSPKGRKK